MASKELSEGKRREIEELARGWGKLVAREAFPEGVGLEIDLFAIEELAAVAAKSLVRGVVETTTQCQAEALRAEHACPGCGRRCELEHRQRSIQVRGGPADLVEPVGHCPTCRRDFFPSASRSEDRWPSV